MDKFVSQVKLLLWKRRIELTRHKSELVKYIAPPFLFFIFLILLYEVFDGLFYDGGIEDYLVPVAFWIFVQKNIVNIMFEKSSKLQESMRMMGLQDVAYWISYFLSDGIILGFLISFVCALCSTYGLFNDGNFFDILGMLFLFCMSSVTFGFFLCSFLDSPQTAGQITIGVLLGFYVVYIAATLSTANSNIQGFCCLFPPLALQIGCASFRKSYTGIDISSICGIMFADIFIYTFLAWYFSQVWPSEFGVAKPFYFPLLPEYWFPKSVKPSNRLEPNDLEVAMVLSSGHDPELSFEAKNIPTEIVNETTIGRPTVNIKGLSKTYGNTVVVNKIRLELYENQIFTLLGHNGAGKTTTVNMLTGLISPDYSSGDASIYGSSVSHNMEQIRDILGICPQHDVLFENLNVKEHILFFSQLKGSSYKTALDEALSLANQFHLEERLDHIGSELSGGQKRKLSVAIAVCGGSKFIVLDEPTAGMDPLARRELWDLLSSLRHGRTLMLITHYMDEADVLGDRIGIMALGNVQCVGSSQFLKTFYGAGYQLIFDKSPEMNVNHIESLSQFVTSHITGSKYSIEESTDVQLVFILPFDSVKQFGHFFSMLQNNLSTYRVLNFGVTITSLEDVFLKVGEDHSVTPTLHGDGTGIGSKRVFNSTITSQIIGIMYRRLGYAINDFVTIPLVLLPIVVAVVGAVLYGQKTITKDDSINDIVVAAMYLGAYIGTPGLIAEFIVRERANRLRNVLTVMGCNFSAYWIGSFIADYILLTIPLFFIYLSWFAAGMSDFYTKEGAISFLIFPIFNFQLIGFSYICSYMFSSPKSCIAFMPLLIIFLLLCPNIIISLVFVIFVNGLKLFTYSSNAIFGTLLWGTVLLSPHGALLASLLDTVQNFGDYISSYPPAAASISIMVIQGVVFFYFAYILDLRSMQELSPQVDASFDESLLNNLDKDILNERELTLSIQESTDVNNPLLIKRLRKVFPPKREGGKIVTAVQDICFHVEKGEIFGLLGANGAGKTTTLSMLTRHLVPTAGNAFVANHSILNDFTKASTHLGVVTQTNSLWDLLSVENHLYLFARLRGVPEDQVASIVDNTIDQLELTPHRKKLAERLSGGMKRKLCVAIALIGDPEVVLLDEPSAGLDPVSRRNLWNVILKTMSNRAVVLTTHSMEEAEALCRRIGIMVHGQLQALGNKQHLKAKFGSGYELVVKLVEQQTADVSSSNKKDNVKSLTLDTNPLQISPLLTEFTAFITGIIPEAKFVSDNGGLVTFNIPKERMDMGLIFTSLEANKEKLYVENYSVAQPTLEQVFIRTVQAYQPINERGHSVQRLRDSLANTGKTNEEYSVPIDAQVAVAMNACGCRPKVIKICTAVNIALFALFLGIYIATTSSLLFAIAIIFFVIFAICFVICCCPCFQPPKDDEE